MESAFEWRACSRWRGFQRNQIFPQGGAMNSAPEVLGDFAGHEVSMLG